METFDILLDSTEQLQADSNGDFVTGDCRDKYISYIIQAYPGHYKQYPSVGVGIFQFINSTASEVKIENAIKSQLSNDGFKNLKIDVSNFPTIAVNDISVNV